MSERTHRHQLEKNILADWLGEKIEILKPYGMHLAIAGVVVAVAIAGSIYYFSRTDAAGPRAWQAYLSAFGERNIDDALEDAFQKSEVKGTSAEFWARLSYADQRFQFAAIQAAQDPDEAKTALADAEKALLPIEKNSHDPTLLARCRFSLARVYETQSKLDKARDYYQKVVETGKDTALGKAAAEAAARLDPAGEVTQVITWLSEQKPLAAKTPGTGNSFLDSLGPGFGQPAPTLPERPNLNIPGSGSPFGPSGSGGIDFGRDDPLGPKGAAPEGDPPKGTEPVTKGADEKPAAEKPADEKATVEKPAEPAKAADEEKPDNKP